jgi:O-antigen ligase
LFTLSRGAAVAGAIGILVLLWNAGPTKAARGLLRVSCVGLVFAAAEVFSAITDARSVGGYDPGQNIDARVLLIHLAWDQFLSSPLTGTGWLALRDVSPFSVPISFAHNVVLSFLQIGGLFGALFLAIVAKLMIVGYRNRAAMVAATTAAIAMSFSDPFLEGGVGALIAWLTIGYAAFGSNDLVSEDALSRPEDMAPPKTSGDLVVPNRKT